MDEVSKFAAGAKSLAGNPIGIIALFIVLIYGFASMVLMFGGHLSPEDRAPLVWFLVIFPGIVLGVFGWLVSSHHEKLYSPRDYSSDASFLQALSRHHDRQLEVSRFNDATANRVREVITSSEFAGLVVDDGTDVKTKLANKAEDIARKIQDASSITIDARAFLQDDSAVYSYPAVMFGTVQELLDEVYFLLRPNVNAFTYGSEWFLKEIGSDTALRKLKQRDLRSLAEAGIAQGSHWQVVSA
jgi:hypothetical protein